MRTHDGLYGTHSVLFAPSLSKPTGPQSTQVLSSRRNLTHSALKESVPK